MLTFSPPSWLKDKQSLACEQAARVGLPGKNDESWRYTSLKDFSRTEFSPVSSAESAYAVPNDVKVLAAEADHVLYFYNGAYLKAESKAQTHEELLVVPLGRALMSAGRIQELAKFLLERAPSENLKSIGWKNRAHFEQGAFVHLRGQSEAPVKVAVIHLYGRGNALGPSPFVIYPRNIYSFGPNTQAELFEATIAANNIAFQVNSSTDIILEANSHVSVAQMIWPGEEAYVFNDLYSTVARDADLQLFNLTLSGHLTRNELMLRLTEEGASARVLGLSVGRGKSHIDNSTFICHEKGQTTSEQISKNILRDSARIVFSGRMRIDRDAQKSNARQHCHNLLLSDSAEADARPQLEVFADDVKAVHGATVGQINPEEIFYLRSRGIAGEEAVKMVTRGFQRDLVEKINSRFIRQALHRCLEGAE